MAVNYAVDENDVLKKMVLRVMKGHKRFRILQKLRFLFTWRLGEPEYDKEGVSIIAMVRKLPNRERDIYERDVELRVHLSAWEEMSDKQRFRTVYHELSHINVEVDEAMQPMADEDGRIKYTMLPHDVLIRTFKEELELFGIPPEYQRTFATIGQGRPAGEANVA